MSRNNELLNGVEAEYVAKGNHNPYEDALNFRDQHELIELFLRIPEVPENLGELSSFERYRMVSRLESFRVPFLSIQNLAFDIYSMIASRYDKYKGSFEWDSLDKTSQNHSSKQSDQSEIDTILLLGISGIGKTTAVEEIVADLNQVILHESYEGHLFIRTQIVFLIVDCPAKATIGGFLRQVLMAFDKALGNTNYFEKSKRKTIDTMLSEVVSLVSEYHVGIIILDEINHLVNNRQSDSELSNLLTTLTNLINIPLVFVGTYKAEDLLCQNLRTTRRILKNGYLNWNRLEEDSQEWQFFINELLRLQYTLTFNEPTEELKHVLYDVSQGILAIAVSVFGRTQRKVILDELNPEEIITAQDIQETLKSDFSFLVPMLKAIKNKQTRKLIGYEDIYDQLDLLGESLKISPKEEEKAKRAFNKEIKKIREERKRRPQKLFDKLKQLSLFTFISDDELENLIIELLKDNTVTTLPESEILQTILIEALNLEQEKREDFNKNKVKTEEELSELETPAQQLNTSSNGNQISYDDYQQNNMIGGLDDF